MKKLPLPASSRSSLTIASTSSSMASLPSESANQSGHQRIIWPWETRKWPELKIKITDPIGSIIDLDGRIASMYQGKARPRQLVELFTRYYSDDQYSKDRIPQDFFFKNIIPMMQKMLEGAPKLFRGTDTRVLTGGRRNNVSLTRMQVATIISGMWFGLFDYDYLSKGPCKIEEFSEANFLGGIISQKVFMIQCLVNYFGRVYTYTHSADEAVRDLFNAGSIVIKRTVLGGDGVQSIPTWSAVDVPIAPVLIGEGSVVGTIGNVDDSPAKMHVVYAHEYLGGDMFKETLTQEEVIMLVRPELLVVTMFCARLQDNETVTVLGAEKMSQYSGIGSSVKFMGNFVDSCPIGYSADETEAMMQQAVIFMDASPKTSGVSQFISNFERDLNKALCGFSSLSFKKREAVASGNWTYGFTGGNMQLKFIQQIMAANVAGKDLIYYPFSKDFEDRVILFNDWIQRNHVTVGGLFRMYMNLMRESYAGPNSRLGDLDVFECLQDF